LLIEEEKNMNNYNSNKNFRNFDDRSFGDRRRSFGGRDGSDRPRMVKAVCDQCGADCELPFKPTGDKPVYCSSCFEKKGGRDGGRRDSGRRDSGRGFDRNDRGGRFDRNDRNDRGGRGSSNQQVTCTCKAELEEVSNKLNQILEILAVNKIKARKTPKSKAAKAVKKSKTVKAKKEVIETPITE
jgi:CxxC-x17-CxxC domain-containing protein